MREEGFGGTGEDGWCPSPGVNDLPSVIKGVRKEGGGVRKQEGGVRKKEGGLRKKGGGVRMKD